MKMTGKKKSMSIWAFIFQFFVAMLMIALIVEGLSALAEEAFKYQESIEHK